MAIQILLTRKVIAFTLYSLLVINGITSLSAQSVEKQTVLAVLTLNVARFSTWPEQSFSHTDNHLNICVVGSNIVQQSFEAINKKIVNHRTIHIINATRLRNLKQCQLIYISELAKNKLIPLLDELSNQAILTVGEDEAFLFAGGMIGLEKINGKIRLTVNLPIVKQSGLIISSRLLKLANVISPP